MNLGKMRRSGYAVDDFAAPVATAASAAAEANLKSSNTVVVEKVVEVPVYVDRVVEKIVEKPVYVDRVVEVEKIVEVPAKASTENSVFFDDFIPADWETEKAEAAKQQTRV